MLLRLVHYIARYTSLQKLQIWVSNYKLNNYLVVLRLVHYIARYTSLQKLQIWVSNYKLNNYLVVLRLVHCIATRISQSAILWSVSPCSSLRASRTVQRVILVHCTWDLNPRCRSSAMLGDLGKPARAESCYYADSNMLDRTWQDCEEFRSMSIRSTGCSQPCH